MTIHDLKALCRLHKENGQTSRISVPIVVFEQVLEQALAYQKLPVALREFVKQEEGTAK